MLEDLEQRLSLDTDTSSLSSSSDNTDLAINRRALDRQKSENRLIHLLKEFIQTERKYVQDLDETCRVYLPLAGWDYVRRSKSADRRRKHSSRRRSSADTGGNSSTSLEMEEDIIVTKPPSKQEIRQMLGNIDELRDYHNRVMLPKLEGAVLNGDSQAIRNLFKGEQTKLSILYGRYCINKSRSSIIVEEYKRYFATIQFKRELLLRVDAELIKPIQRLTRYHMFLSSLSKTARELGLNEAAQHFSTALEAILDAAEHTNTMMWIGRMEECPLDLASQGQLLKKGRVLSRLVKVRRKSFTGWGARVPQGIPSFILLFQHSVIICRELSSVESSDPRLVYFTHVSVNQVRVRDICAEDALTFELQRVEGVKLLKSQNIQEGSVAKIACATEEEKNEWVGAINTEVKILRSVAKSLSNNFLTVAM